MLFVGRQAYPGELYFLDGHQTLLYKTINWWYYAPVEDAEKIICGAAVQYSYRGKTRHSYDESSMTLTVSPEDGFADLLSVLSPGENLRRTLRLQGKKGSILSESIGDPFLTIEEQSLSNKYTLSFKPITFDEYQQLTKDIQSWRFVLSGKIWGLRSGKLALYRAADNLQNCCKINIKTKDQARFTLRISRKTGNDVLAEFVLKEKQALNIERRNKNPSPP